MRHLRERLRDPLVWTDVLQIVKTVVAAVLAWVLAVEVFSLPQPFLAPWAALLTIHATVYRTVARGMQQAAAAVVGVLLAFAAGVTLGVSWVSLALVLLVALTVGTLRPMRAESTTAAATALVVLLTGYSDDGSMLLSRLADTLIGIGTGFVVTLAVWPPLRDRSAARRIDVLDGQLGALLAGIAHDLREQGDGAPDPGGWVERTRELDGGIDDAWADVQQARESGRLNLRRQAARRIQDTRDLGGVLLGLEQAVAETRSMARTTRPRRAGRGLGAGLPRRLDRRPRPGRDRAARRRPRCGRPRARRSRVARRRRRRAPAGPGRPRRQPAQHPRGDGPCRRRPARPRPRPPAARRPAGVASPGRLGSGG